MNQIGKRFEQKLDQAMDHFGERCTSIEKQMEKIHTHMMTVGKEWINAGRRDMEDVTQEQETKKRKTTEEHREETGLENDETPERDEANFQLPLNVTRGHRTSTPVQTGTKKQNGQGLVNALKKITLS